MPKKIISLLLTLCLMAAVCIVPAGAYGSEAPADDDLFLLEPDPESGDMTVSSDEDDTPSAAFFMTAAQDGDSSSSLPTSYDPRGSYSLPAVRYQGSWNTCWLLAAIGTAEFSGLGCTDISSLNYSERHLVYFAANQADDPLGNSSEDYNTDESYWIRYGGNPTLAMMTMACWHGVASEAVTNTPYSGLSTADSIDAAFAYTDELHLENTMVMNLSTAADRDALKEMLMTYGSAVMCMYFSASYLYYGNIPAETADDEEDITADETEDTVVTDGASADINAAEDTASDNSADTAEDPAETDPESAEISDAETPSASGSETEETPAAEPVSDDSSAAEVIPEEITAEPTEDSSDPESEASPAALDGIAEADVFAADASDEAAAVPIDGTGETAEEGEYTVCYYQPDYTTTNHEVLVVGWDDDYPAENFGNSSSGAVPEGDGAWLCRNSYGPDWPEADADGYFWVSYYDASVSYDGMGKLEQTRAVVFDYGSADNYDNNYEYDGAAVQGYINDAIGTKGVSTTSASTSTKRSYANVFTATASELRGYELLRAVSTYTYREQVPYTFTVYIDLTDPADPTSGTASITQSGTFTYAGFHTITLDNAVTLPHGVTYSVVFTVGASSDLSVFVPACYTLSNWRAVNASASGQSFVSLDGTAWYDCQDLKRQGNVRIKAYTDTCEAVFPFTDVSSDKWYYSDVDRAWRTGLVEGITSDTYCPASVATRASAITMLYRLAGSPTPVNTTDFDDVGTQKWYYDAVCWAQENGLIQGSDDDNDGVYSFRPDDRLTRLELVAILYRYAQLMNFDNLSSRDSLRTFVDTPAISAWGIDAEQWSVGCGLQCGSLNDDGTLSLLPYRSVTRAMLAAYMIRLYDML